MYTKYKIVPFCPYHFVHTILSNNILSVYHFVHTILSVPFCPLPFCPVTDAMCYFMCIYLSVCLSVRVFWSLNLDRSMASIGFENGGGVVVCPEFSMFRRRRHISQDLLI